MQVFPLLCTGCGEPLRIIAFVTEVNPASGHRVLAFASPESPDSHPEPGQ